jgi:hypothetical protein
VQLNTHDSVRSSLPSLFESPLVYVTGAHLSSARPVTLSMVTGSVPVFVTV